MDSRSPPILDRLLHGAGGKSPRMRAVVEDGLPIITVTRGQHGSGRREIGGGPDVQVIVALSAIHQIERRTQFGVLRKTPIIGAVTVADPAERTVFTVHGEVDVLQISVSMRLIAEAANTHVRSVRPLFNEHDAAIEASAMGALVALKDGSGHSDLLLHSIAFRIANILGRRGASVRDGAPRRGGISSPALKRVYDLVQARLDEPTPASPTLAELARAAGISKHHFIKAFREVVGETPYAWVVRQRIERARALLTQADATVGDVAFQTGFSSAAHLVAAFRQRLGVTPGAFKDAVLG